MPLASPWLTRLNWTEPPVGMSLLLPGLPAPPTPLLWGRVYHVTKKRALLSLEDPELGRLRASDATVDTSLDVFLAASMHPSADASRPVSTGALAEASMEVSMETSMEASSAGSRAGSNAATRVVRLDLTKLLFAGDLVRVAPLPPLENTAGGTLAAGRRVAAALDRAPLARLGKHGWPGAAGVVPAAAGIGVGAAAAGRFESGGVGGGERGGAGVGEGGEGEGEGGWGGEGGSAAYKRSWESDDSEGEEGEDGGWKGSGDEDAGGGAKRHRAL